jgi:hypothetical protein
MIAARQLLDPHTLPVVAALAAAGLGAVFALYWLVWFDAAERSLVRGLILRRR